MKDFLSLAAERYSVRKFSDRPIEQEKLDAILRAGQIAPTAGNYQAQRVFVVQSKEGMATLRTLTKCHYGAPTVLIVGYDKQSDWKNPNEAGVHSGEQDASIVATHMMLEAWEIGVGSCWVNFFAPSQVKAAFNLPENFVPVLMLPIGYADEKAAPAKWHTEYKDLTQTVQYL